MLPRSSKDKGFLAKSYEWVLELPVSIVLAVCWFVGVMLIGLCALLLYIFWLLLKVAAGA